MQVKFVVGILIFVTLYALLLGAYNWGFISGKYQAIEELQ